MYLDAKLKAFINGPQGMGMVTRDAQLVSEFAKPLGAQVIDDTHIKVFVDLNTSGKTFQNIDDNALMSVVFVSMSYESFQFKGKCIRYNPMPPEDVPVFETYMKGFDKWVEMLGMPAGAVYKYPHSSMMTLVMEVHEIFEQTPKIGTGNKV